MEEGRTGLGSARTEAEPVGGRIFLRMRKPLSHRVAFEMHHEPPTVGVAAPRSELVSCWLRPAQTSGSRGPREAAALTFDRSIPRAPAAWPAVAGVFSLGLLSFAFALWNGPLGDDRILLEQRLAGSGPVDLVRLFGESWWGALHEGGLYRPLSLVLLSIQKLAFGSALAGFRTVGLLVHAATGVLCLGFLRRLGAPSWAAFAGAAVFACHPIHAEAVATVHGQPDLWAAFLALAALVALRPGQPVSHLRAASVGALGLASFLCKESALLLPLAAFALRLDYANEGHRARRLGRGEVALLAALAIYLGLRVAVLGAEAMPRGEGSVAFGYPLWARLQLGVVTVATYARLLVAPWGQTVYYGHLREAIFGTPWLELAVLVTTLAGLWWLRARLTAPLEARLVRIALVGLVLALLPVANLLPIGTAVAERCLYLPSLALAPLAAALWLHGAAVRPGLARIVLSLVLVISLGLCVRVAAQWRTPLSHWEATVRAHPQSPTAHAIVGRLRAEALSIGAVPLNAPDWNAARTSIDRALELNPSLAEAWIARGIWWQARSRCDRAQPAFERALVLRPGDPSASAGLAACLKR